MEQQIKDAIDQLPDLAGLTLERNLERKRFIKCFVDHVIIEHYQFYVKYSKYV